MGVNLLNAYIGPMGLKLHEVLFSCKKVDLMYCEWCIVGCLHYKLIRVGMVIKANRCSLTQLIRGAVYLLNKYLLRWP